MGRVARNKVVSIGACRQTVFRTDVLSSTIAQHTSSGPPQKKEDPIIPQTLATEVHARLAASAFRFRVVRLDIGFSSITQVHKLGPSYRRLLP